MRRENLNWLINDIYFSSAKLGRLSICSFVCFYFNHFYANFD